MKFRFGFLLAVTFAEGLLYAAPRSAVLYVQNRCSGETRPPLGQVAQWIANGIAGNSDDISVIMPDHAIPDLKATDRGISVKALGENLNGAEGVLVASVQRFSYKKIPGHDKESKYRLSVGMTLTLYDREGKTVPTATASFGERDGYSKTYSEDDMEANSALLHEKFLEEASNKLAGKFLHSFDPSKWPAAASIKLNVFFGCNVLGAVVKIDGLSCGTCPAQLALSPGVHKVLVSYPPYYYEFRQDAAFNQEGQTYKVVLQLTPDGEAQRNRTLEYEMKRTELDKALVELEKTKNDNAAEYEKKKLALEREKKAIEGDEKERVELFAKQLELADAMLERYGKSGDADDYVRRTVADGTAVYWKNSYGRIAITSGTANKIDFATPATDVGDIVYPPDPGDIGKGLKNLLMLKPRATVEVQEAIKSQTSGNVERQ